MKQVYKHWQARYCHSASLGTKIQLSLLPEIKYYNRRFRATLDNLKSMQSGTRAGFTENAVRGADIIGKVGQMNQS